MPNINKIKLSGTSYDIQDANATKTVELTQAQYDALVTGGTVDSNTFYIITDGEMFNPSGKVDTSAFTEFSGAVETELSGKTDESAFTAHTGDSTIHVTAQDKTNWNAKSNFSGDYNDLTNKPTIPTVPTNVSSFNNDAGYATSGYVQSVTSDMATKTWVGQQGYLTQHQDISGKQDVSGMTAYTETSAFTAHTSDTTVHVTANEKSTWNAKSDFSGSYNDLTNKLSAGTNITIVDNVISATGGGGGMSSGEVQTMIDESISGKVDTSAITSSVTSASTDNEIPTAKAVYDAIPQGGGKAISAGRGISVTTGETADTVSFSLPISAGTSSNSLKIVGGQVASAQYSIAIGTNSQAKGIASIAIGGSTANGQTSFAQGTSYAQKWQSSAFGQQNYSNNNFEASFGNFNKSVSASTTFGDSGNTLFSVGNGTSNLARHNAFEIRQNGDIYCSDGTNDVKLQDTITATAANTTALGGLSLVKLTQTEYDALATKDSNVLYVIVG